jgi:hypothetical protein
MNRGRFLCAPVHRLLATQNAPLMKKLLSVCAIGGLLGALLCGVGAFAAIFMSLAAGPPGDPWGDWLSHISGEFFAFGRVCLLVGAIGGIPYVAFYVDWHAADKEPPPRNPENNLLD